MSIQTILRHNYKAVSTIVLAFVAIALIATFVQPLKYSVETKLLVVQDFGNETDAYNISRLNEYLSSLLVQITTSETFFNQTLESGFDIDTNYFAGSQKKQMKLWENTIEANSTYDSGIITLTIYHPEKQQALNIARAATYTLKTSNGFYHNLPTADVRVIDSPSASLLPAKPNIPFNIALGVFAGLIVGILYGYYQENRVAQHVAVGPMQPQHMTGFQAVAQPEPHDPFARHHAYHQ